MLFERSRVTEQHSSKRPQEHSSELPVVMACKMGEASGGGASRKQVHHHNGAENGRRNGLIHNGGGEATFKAMNGGTSTRSAAATTVNLSTGSAQEREHTSVAAFMNGGASVAPSSQTRYVDCRTSPLITLLFHRTLMQANLDKDIVRRLDIEPLVRKLSPKDIAFIHGTCDRYLEYIRNSKDVSVDSHVRGIESFGWELSDNNVYVEFKKVVNETFDENVSWGGVIGFLGFALGFSVFIYNKGMKQTVVSVVEWTKQVIEEDIGRFFLKNNGWDGFNEAVETLLRRQRRRKQARPPGSAPGGTEDSPSFWQGAIAMTTVAAGAALLVGLRQAFS